jgi:hypothetical protein
MLTVAAQLDLYLDKQPDLLFLQRVLTATRESCQVSQTGRQHETASQMLEYAPLRSLPYLQRWLKSNINSKTPLQTLVELRRYYETFIGFPAMEDCFSSIRTAVATIGLSSDFASSQVRILVMHYQLLRVFADSFVIESFATAQ